MAVTGKDVSSYQPVHFDASGDSFAMVKCTEGTGYVNPNYAGQLAHSRALKLVTGHYHFGHGGGVAEAKFFLAHVDLKPGDFIAYDWEASGDTQAARDAFMKYVKGVHPNVKVILYCNTDWWFNNDTESYCGDGLWIADPNHAEGHPAVSHAWLFHQYSSAGGVDRNVANFPSAAALRSWAAWSVPTPPKPVTPPAALNETVLSVSLRVGYSVKASADMTVAEIGVAVKDVHGDAHNFPPEAYNISMKAGEAKAFITPEMTLPAGSYELIPCYKTVDGAWHNLPVHAVTV